MAKSFSEQVGAFVAKTPQRMRLVFQESVQDLISEAQKPIAKGGNMPVDTGFLTNSGQAALNSIPSGLSTAPEGYQNHEFDMTATALVINRAQLDDRIVFGWTANYAPYMESKYAFSRLAVQNWNDIVQRNAKKLESMNSGN